MKKVILLTFLLLSQPAFAQEVASSSVAEENQASTTSTTSEEVVLSTSSDPISLEENSTSTRSLEEKAEIATMIVIKVEQILPVFEAYLNRIDLINLKIEQKGAALESDSEFFVFMEESKNLKESAGATLKETRALVSDLKESNLDEQLVLIRENMNQIKTNIILSKEASKKALDYLRVEALNIETE